MDPAAVLCAELARALGVHVRPNEMKRALETAGLVLAQKPAPHD